MLNREVAIKVVTGDEPLAQARLWREAEHASGLNHPNICTIHQVGDADGLAYILMEYVEGQPLADVIPAGGLPSEIVLRYAGQVAGALAHAHEHGIVHRDLKSSNVMTQRTIGSRSSTSAWRVASLKACRPASKPLRRPPG
jgi:serine/threonine-protein kinase